MKLGLKLDISSEDDDDVEGAFGAGGRIFDNPFANNIHDISCEIGSDGINIVKEDLHIAGDGIKDTNTGEYILCISADDFEVMDKLGHGASGSVFKVYHEPTKKYMALKSINVFDQGKRKQLVNDLRSLKKNQCPFLVKFYGAYYEEGDVKIALELMELGSLGSMLKLVKEENEKNEIPNTIPILSEQIIANIAFQVLNGLAFLHVCDKSVHRDIKPDNILINKRGVVKLTDFGITKCLNETLMLCNTFVGTMYYMSPERMDGEKYSHQSDIWALGIICIELATGEYPYKMCKNYIEMLNCVKETDVNSIIPGELSNDFKDFLKSCLQQDPELRGTALELCQHPYIEENTMHDQCESITSWASEMYEILQENKES